VKLLLAPASVNVGENQEWIARPQKAARKQPGLWCCSVGRQSGWRWTPDPGGSATDLIDTVSYATPELPEPAAWHKICMIHYILNYPLALPSGRYMSQNSTVLIAVILTSIAMALFMEAKSKLRSASAKIRRVQKVQEENKERLEKARKEKEKGKSLRIRGYFYLLASATVWAVLIYWLILTIY